jgi:hypothetical protein
MCADCSRLKHVHDGLLLCLHRAKALVSTLVSRHINNNTQAHNNNNNGTR